MTIKLVHKEWEDDIIIDFNIKKLYRTKVENEHGTFKIINNILFIKWDKWDEEIFINANNNTNNNSNNDTDNDAYYYVEEYDFIHKDWEDKCYIDYFNNIIYRKSNRTIGYFDIESDKINITWKYNENEIISNEKKYKIPNIIHFVYGFKKQDEEFELYKYISIKSAYDINKPDKIYFHYHYEPYGYWWDKIKPLLTLNKVELPTEIFGNNLSHYAHRADIVRLQKLNEIGGIYLDIDTICLKSFNDLLDYDFVMGEQNNSNYNEIYGLCNAVILAKPNSIFGLKWYESYKTFRSKGRDVNWDEHSVIKPLHLSKEYNNEITVLKHNAFFYPLWYTINDILFNEKYDLEEYKKIIKNNYCIHLWDTYSHNYLKNLTEEYILNKNTLYNVFARKFLRNDISIVFLTYNRLDITKRCLDSYLKCLDNNDNIKELIILDNNSNNDMINYLKYYRSQHEKIKIIFSDENLGVCGGRTVLFEEAIGDIIVSLDSDAYLLNSIFFDKISDLLYDEKYGIIGISGAYIRSWEFGTQEDIPEHEEKELIVDHIAGCCQVFRKDLSLFGFKLDPYYDKFWVEDTDLCMQSLYLNKINFKINQQKYIEHHWGGSGKEFIELFVKNWNYFSNKWKNKVLLQI